MSGMLVRRRLQGKQAAPQAYDAAVAEDLRVETLVAGGVALADDSSTGRRRLPSEHVRMD